MKPNITTHSSGKQTPANRSGARSRVVIGCYRSCPFYRCFAIYFTGYGESTD